MDRVWRLLRRLAKKVWLFLITVPVLMLEERVTSYLNRVLDAHAGPLAASALSVVHWLTAVGIGVTGTFVLIVGVGLIVYSYYESRPEANLPTTREKRPKQAKTRSIPKRFSKRNFFSEVLFPPLACTLLITLIALALMWFFGVRSARISLVSIHRLDVPDKYGVNIEIENIADNDARKVYFIGRAYEEPLVSEQWESDAVNQFIPLWKSKQRTAPAVLPNLDAHQSAIVTVWFDKTEEKDIKFRKTKLVFVVIGTVSFEDGAGHHEKNVCAFIKYDSLPIVCHSHNDQF